MRRPLVAQDPVDVAVAFCARSSPPEASTTCSDSVSAHIIEMLGSARPPPPQEAEAEQQQQQLNAQLETQRHSGERVATSTEEPLMTVPLNINGVETVLKIFRGSRAEDLADELCRRKQHDLHGSAFDSCFSQV